MSFSDDNMQNIEAMGPSNRPTEAEMKRKVFPGYGLPAGSDFPEIEEFTTEPDEVTQYSRSKLENVHSISNGYAFYVIGKTVFAKDISGYFYKLNNAKKVFEWFHDGWLEDNSITIGVTVPCAPYYVSFNIFNQPVYPLNEENPPRPTLPKNELGIKIFPMKDQLPLFPIDFNGVPCIPFNDDGEPQWPYLQGFPCVPLDTNGYPIFPRSPEGKPIYPKNEFGMVYPPISIHGERVVSYSKSGSPELPLDANGEELISVVNVDGYPTVMTQEERLTHVHMLAMSQSSNKEEKMNYNHEQMLEQHLSDYSYQSSSYQTAHHAHHAAVQAETEAKVNKARSLLNFAKMKMNKTADSPKPAPAKKISVESVFGNKKDDSEKKQAAAVSSTSKSKLWKPKKTEYPKRREFEEFNNKRDIGPNRGMNMRNNNGRNNRSPIRNTQRNRSRSRSNTYSEDEMDLKKKYNDRTSKDNRSKFDDRRGYQDRDRKYEKTSSRSYRDRRD